MKELVGNGSGDILDFNMNIFYQCSAKENRLNQLEPVVERADNHMTAYGHFDILTQFTWVCYWKQHY